MCIRDSSEVLLQLLKGRAESRGRLEVPEAPHRVVTLLHAAMALLGVVVQVLRRAMLCLASNNPADRFAVRGVLVRGDAVRSDARHFYEPPEEAPRGIPVAVLAEHGVQQFPITVDGTVQIAPAARDLHVRLVEIPGLAGTATSLRA